MEVYRRETQKIIDRFLDHRLTCVECRSALDTALVNLTLRTPQAHLVSLSELISENGKIVRKEMERRTSLEQALRISQPSRELSRL